MLWWVTFEFWTNYLLKPFQMSMNVCWGYLDVNKPALTSLEPLNVAVTMVMLWTVMEKAVLKVSFYININFYTWDHGILSLELGFPNFEKEKKKQKKTIHLYMLTKQCWTCLYVELTFCSHMTSWLKETHDSVHVEIFKMHLHVRSD